MYDKLFIVIGLSCAATCAIGNDRLPLSDQVAQCLPHMNAIGVIRGRIDAGRKVLTGDETDCAIEEFTTTGLSRYCVQVKSTADVAKLRIWNDDVQHAWDALNRVRLQLRQTEECLGIECEPG
jgi:hypothetical protein